MSEAQRLWTHVVAGHPPESAGGRHDARDWQERSEHQNSNELAAQAVARCVLGRQLTRQELGVAAPLFHYLFGATVAAMYGAYAERRHVHRSGAGFGTTVWLAADEVAMPLLGLSQSTLRRPLEMHLQSLFAHLVYGTATEITRRALRAPFDARHRLSREERGYDVENEEHGTGARGGRPRRGDRDAREQGQARL